MSEELKRQLKNRLIVLPFMQDLMLSELLKCQQETVNHGGYNKEQQELEATFLEEIKKYISNKDK